jgi:hypothetical protein
VSCTMKKCSRTPSTSWSRARSTKGA